MHLYVDTLLEWNQVSLSLATLILCLAAENMVGKLKRLEIRLQLMKILKLQRMNLTAVKEVNEVMERHIEDSLAIIPPIRNSYLSHCSPSSSNNLSLVDVGSGAGLPGLVLAIACPGKQIFLLKFRFLYFYNMYINKAYTLLLFWWVGWEVTLMESMNKRCLFLEHVVSHIGLSNVQVVRGRAEVLFFVLL